MAAAAAITSAGIKLAVKKGAKKKGASVFLNSYKSFKKQGLGKQAMESIFGKKTAKAPAQAAEEKKPTLADHLKSMQEVFGGVGEKLKSFGTSTVVAAADLESDKIGFDFLVSKLKPPGGKGGKGKGPASAAALEKSFADYWTALRDNAQTTAFSADDVLKGGMQAIKLTKGDTGKAMQLVKLAEDMAGFNPGKSVAEAMEAIEAANGKDYKKLEEFGFEFKKGSWNKFLSDAGKWFDGGSKKLNQSANGMWEIVTEGLKGSLQNAGVAALDQVKPIMQRLVTWLTNGGFKKLENLAAKTVDVLVKSFLWLADVLGPVFGWLEKALDWISANFETLRPILNGLVAAFAAFTVISTVASIISGIGVFIGLLSNPIFWIVAAIGLLTAAWTGNWGGIQDKTKAAIAWIVSAYSGFVKSIKQFVEDTKQLFADLGAWINQLWQDAVSGVEQFVSQLVTGTITRWNQLVNTVTQLGQQLKAWLSQTWSNIVKVTDQLLTQAWQAVSSAFQAVWTTVSGIMMRIYQFHALIWNGMGKIISGAGSFIIGTVRSAFRAVSGIITAAFDTIVGIGQAAMEMLRGIFVGVWQGAAGDHLGAVQTIRNAVMGAIGKVGGLLTGFASKSIGHAKSFVSGYASGLGQLYQTVQDAVMPVWQVITQTWDDISRFVVETAKAIWSGLQAVGNAISTFARKAIDTAIDAIQSGFGRARSFIGTFRQWLDATIDGIIQSTIESFHSFTEFMESIGPAMKEFLDRAFDTFANKAVETFFNVLKTIDSTMQELWTIITGTLSKIREFFSNVLDTVTNSVMNAFRTMYNWAANTLNALWGVISPVLSGIGEFTFLMWGIIIGAFAWGVRIVYDLMTGFAQQAMSFGTQFMESLIQGIQSMYGTLFQTVQQIWDSIKSIFGSAAATVNMSVTPINGSHRNGLNRVPFNGYIAQLHQGEMVLTSEQAGQYRSGQLSAEQQSSMLQPYSPPGAGSVNNSKSVEIANLVGEIHVHDEADENRFIEKLKRMLEEDLLTEGEGVYAG
ncbi:hypothetical protein SAMN05216378_3496 [Paenibacillus catalpae]|uniref:Phage-related protein n=1 Tax=Paenibacillus catalpae TaxID=1045775 RepID=A0A1I2BHG6_9BACL|nr:hypothetical protein [Paenibacillus catalpae]SFE54630.1 hypothetical protein SAMN05216378_3496 [Paenibacillus catalpae]